MKVSIVRHGKVPSNVLRVYNAENDDLTELGVSQAMEAREKIKDEQFDIVISSPLLRARHTAEIIANDNTIIFDDRLKERDCGDLSGKPFATTNREEYWNYYTDIHYGTSEHIQDFFKRISDFLDELKTKDYQSVLVVAHSGVAKAFSGYFEGIQDGKFLNRGIKNCEIKVYEL